MILSINGNPITENSLPLRYHVSGVIQLPYAEIREPFESWVDVNAGFSRIDYYGGKYFSLFKKLAYRLKILGAAKTVQRKARGGEDFGASYKIVPMSGMKKNVIGKIFFII